MKTTQIHLRISEIDKDKLKALSDKKQMSMSEYLVDLIRRESEKENIMEKEVKMYKIYAQNVHCVKSIKEATKDDLDACVEEIFNQAANDCLFEIDDENEENSYKQIEAAYDKIYEYWNENRKISSGDYMIIELEEDEEPTRPNVCYTDAHDIFS